MSAHRDKPEIGKKSSAALPGPDTQSCLLMLIGLPLSIVITRIVVRVIYDTATVFEQYVCFGLMIVILTLSIWSWWRDSQAWEAEKKKWMQGCKVAEVKVIGRHGGPWDDGHRFHTSWWLDMEMTPDQAAAAPNATIITAKVSEYLYQRFQDRSTARIYYLPESPLNFFIEEEL